MPYHVSVFPPAWHNTGIHYTNHSAYQRYAEIIDLNYFLTKARGLNYHENDLKNLKKALCSGHNFDERNQQIVTNQIHQLKKNFEDADDSQQIVKISTFNLLATTHKGDHELALALPLRSLNMLFPPLLVKNKIDFYISSFKENCIDDHVWGRIHNNTHDTIKLSYIINLITNNLKIAQPFITKNMPQGIEIILNFLKLKS